jgi:hypothetical protein
LAHASRQSSYLIAGFGAFLQVVAGWWDGFLSGSISQSWTPAHLFLYSGVAITLFAVGHGLWVRRAQLPPVVNPFRFVIVAGLKLTGVGCLIEIIAATWIELSRCVASCEAGFTLAYVLLTIGMLTANLGVAIGLTIEYGMIRREFIIASATRRAVVSFFIMLTFSAIWLAAAGELVHLGGAFPQSSASWVVAFFLALFAAFVLVPLKRVMPRIGSGLGVSIVFNAVAYGFLGVDEGSWAYIPWGILPILLFELALFLLGSVIGFKRAVLFSSMVIGVLFGATYYPFTVYLFPWSFSLQPLILSPVIGCVVGALLGNSVYKGLSAAVLGDVTA